MRALLDTDAYLQTLPLVQGTHPFSQCFRTRAYDYTGPRLWPPAASDSDCVGGSLRAVVWHEELLGSAGHVPFRGYQPTFVGLSGSLATLLALFPDNRPEVDSYFWCTPGVRVMGSDPSRFDAHMNAFATNTLMQTRYDDFLNHVVPPIVVHVY